MIPALTLRQPWAFAVTDLDKLVENRDFRPSHRFIGGPLAIHAGKTIETDDILELRRRGHQVPLAHELVLGAVVAVVTLRGTVSAVHQLADAQQQWFCGPFGWLMADVAVLPEPIPCRGHQALWYLPPDVEDAVKRMLRRSPA
jgi:hypothetical protein